MDTLRIAAQAYAEGDIVATREIADRCLSRARARNDRPVEAQALWQLAQVGMVCGDVTRALAEAQHASLLFDRLTDREGETRSLITVAYAAAQLRDNGLALASAQRALRLSEALGSPALHAAANNYLGVALFWDGDAALADGHLRAAVDLALRMPGSNAHVRPTVNRAVGALVHLTIERVFHDVAPDPSLLTPLVNEISSGCDLAGAMPFLSAGFHLDCETIAAWPAFFSACWRGELRFARECLALCASRAGSGRLALRWIVPYVAWAQHEYARATGRREQAASYAEEMVASAKRIQNRQLVWLGSALKLRALEALGRDNDAARGWRLLIAHDMDQRRRLRRSSDWLLRLEHPGAGGSGRVGPAREELPMFDARTQRQRRLAQWQRRHDLTQAEVQVLDLLVQGKSVAAMSERRGTSVGTVRSQLRSLFDKTELHSQRELIAAFAADNETG